MRFGSRKRSLYPVTAAVFFVLVVSQIIVTVSLLSNPKEVTGKTIQAAVLSIILGCVFLYLALSYSKYRKRDALYIDADAMYLISFDVGFGTPKMRFHFNGFKSFAIEDGMLQFELQEARSPIVTLDDLEPLDIDKLRKVLEGILCEA